MPELLIPEANPQWRWFVDERNGRVCLELAELGFIKTKLNIVNVLDVADVNRRFSVSDTDTYQYYRELLEKCYFWQEQQFSFVCLINAVAIKQFHKLLPAKNWYFVKNPMQPTAGFLFKVKSESDSCESVVLATDGDSVDIMLLDTLTINDNKQLAQFSAQRVAINRLFPLDN
ncbi:MAG: cell division protein ZapC domain-containing protein [Aestuariibacter sp.]